MVFQRAIIMVIFTASPVFVAAAAFTAFTLQGSELTAEVAFTSVGMEKREKGRIWGRKKKMRGRDRGTGNVGREMEI